MAKLVQATLAFLLLATSVYAVNDLAPGDVAIIGYNGKETDTFSFVALVDIDAAVQLKFGLINNLYCTWTAPARGVAQGQVVVIAAKDAPYTATLGTVTSSGYNYESSGDRIEVTQGADYIFVSETLVAYVPPAPLSAVDGTAISHPDGGNPARNGRYKSTAPRTGTRQEILDAIKQNANWDYAYGDPPAYNLNIAPYNSPFTVEPEGPATSWIGNVVDGYYASDGYNDRNPGFTTLSANGALENILTDNNDAVSAAKCFAIERDNISDRRWFSVYFDNDFPSGQTISSVKIYVQHQGASGQSGNIRIHVSDDKTASGWYDGLTGASDAYSADFPWSATEGEAVYDVTSILNTPEKINNCEVLIINRASSTAQVFLDFIKIEVEFELSGSPIVTTDGGVTSPQSTSATLNGSLTAGAPDPDVYVCWGDDPAGTSTGAWDHVVSLGPRSVGPFSTPISGLLANKTYYYTCFATNIHGGSWAAGTLSFTTPGPTVSFTSASSSGPESTPTVTLDLNLSAPSAVSASVNYGIGAGGTATSGDDFNLTAGSRVFPPGATSTSVTFSVVNDTIDEDDETVKVSLSGASGCALGANPTHTYTIVDNDNPPTLAFEDTPYTFPENGGPGTVRVGISARSGKTVTVQYQTIAGTALADVDYGTATGALTWNPGDNVSKTFPVAITNDSSPESAESFQIQLFSPVNASVSGANPVTASIPDDDTGPPSVTTLPPTGVSSNSATLHGNVGSTGGSSTEVWIYYGTSNGGTTPALWATNTYLGPQGIGDFAGPVSSLLPNTTYHYRCYAQNVSGGVWAPASTSFLTGPPTVQFAVASSSGSESTATVTAELTLSSPAPYSIDVTVNLAVAAGGTATAGGVDYTLATPTVVIPAGQTATNIVLSIVNDTKDENDENAAIRISSVQGGTVGAVSTFTYTILDDDAPPTVFFRNAPYTVSEDGGSVTVTVGLSAKSSKSVAVDMSTVDFTAVAGDDYVAKSQHLSWWPEDSTDRDISITILDDGVSEGDRQFLVALADESNATVSGNRQETVTIIEDDNQAPDVTNDGGATGIGSRLARLRGEVTAGIPAPDAWFYWGPTDGGTTPSAWSNGVSVGQHSGAFFLDVFGLSPNTRYHYRCFVTNSAGGMWANSTTNFLTTDANSYYVNDNSRANDVYCSEVGNDANSGELPSLPKATLGAILSAYDLNPGDTVLIDTGVYNLSSTLTVTSDDTGAEGQPVLFRGSTHAAGSIIDRRDSNSDVIRVNISGSAYLRFENLSIKGGLRGIAALGSFGTPCRGIEIVKCKVYDNDPWGDAGIFLQYCATTVVTDCEVRNNGFSGIALDTCSGVIITNNTCYQNVDYGISVLTSYDPVIAYNRCYDQDSIYSIGIAMAYGRGETVTGNTCYNHAYEGILIEGGADGRLARNIIHNNGGDGILINGPGYALTGNRIYANAGNGVYAAGSGMHIVNNLAFNNDGHNFYFHGNNNTMLFENNTVYGGNGVYLKDPSYVTNRHNIFWAIGSGKIGMDVTTYPTGPEIMLSDYNNFYATGGATVGRWQGTSCASIGDWQAVTWKDGQSIGVDPLFADPTVTFDFHLQSTEASYHEGLWKADAADSPCLDRGDPGLPFFEEPDYNGLTVNLGAYGNTDEASKTHYTGPFYSLSVTPNPAEAGTVGVWPPATQYPNNRQVTVWATVVNTDYDWDSWDGDLSGTDMSQSFYVTRAMTAQALFTAKISNTNGVPDWWLEFYELPVSQAGADEDTDLDGLRNWQEFYARTLPRDYDSVLCMTQVSPLSNGRDSIIFRSATGVLYRVEGTTNLSTWVEVPAATTSAGALTYDPKQGQPDTTTLYMQSLPRNRAYRVRTN